MLDKLRETRISGKLIDIRPTPAARPATPRAWQGKDRRGHDRRGQR
ncbi:MAG: hypothetical protein U0R78_05465 [Nocardioidaceae bacterium]